MMKLNHEGHEEFTKVTKVFLSLSSCVLEERKATKAQGLVKATKAIRIRQCRKRGATYPLLRGLLEASPTSWPCASIPNGDKEALVAFVNSSWPSWLSLKTK